MRWNKRHRIDQYKAKSQYSGRGLAVALVVVVAVAKCIQYNVLFSPINAMQSEKLGVFCCARCGYPPTLCLISRRFWRSNCARSNFSWRRVRSVPDCCIWPSNKKLCLLMGTLMLMSFKFTSILIDRSAHYLAPGRSGVPGVGQHMGVGGNFMKGSTGVALWGV